MDYVAKANRYIKNVLSGKQPACEYVKLACLRQEQDLKNAKSKTFPYKFDKEKANRICEFIEMLPHIKGKWAKGNNKIELEDWQCFIETTTFGWVYKTDGTRRFNQAYEEVPRKNAKSTKCAARALYLFGADQEAGAEVYTAATTRDQAKIVFNDARLMAKKSPQMLADLDIKVLLHQLKVQNSANVLQPLAADSDNLDGLNVHGAIIDELHAHKKRDLYDVIVDGKAAREQPLISIITTAGTDLEGICYEIRDYAALVLKGVKDNSFKDDSFFAIIYTIDEDDNWEDVKSWKKANPNYNVSVNPRDLEDSYKIAKQTSRGIANFKTKRLNVWVSSKNAWLNMEDWAACAKELDIKTFEGMQCRISFDLSSKIDFAAKNYLFKKDKDYYTFSQFYYPENQMDKLNSTDRAMYQSWVDAGFITLTPGDIIDYGYIEDDLLQDRDKFEIVEVPFDPFQATQFATRMTAEGFDMVQVGATVKNFSEPMKELESLIVSKNIYHDNNAVMNWMMGNIVAKEDKKANIFPDKEKRSKKIDGGVSLIMNVARYCFEENTGPHAYTERGLIIV